jgi:hypothetical protein
MSKRISGQKEEQKVTVYVEDPTFQSEAKRLGRSYQRKSSLYPTLVQGQRSWQSNGAMGNPETTDLSTRQDRSVECNRWSEELEIPK